MARKCKHKAECSTELPPASKCEDIIQKKGYCSTDCLIKHGRQKASERRRKEHKKELREVREKHKSVSDWLKDAQAVFNRYIRLRDKDYGCISCHMGSDYKTGQWQAGHYRSRGAASHLRFHEDNCHKQCAQCNTMKSGNVVEYRINLVKRIGVERVEALENNNEPHKWTVDEAKEIIKTYKAKIKELEKNNEQDMG